MLRPSSRLSSTSSNISHRHTDVPDTTNVSLDECWSGSVAVGDTIRQGKPSKPFTFSVWSFHTKNNVKGIIFRNKTPVENVRPSFGVYSANRDALRSLKSLDSRLREEYMDISNEMEEFSRETSTKSELSSYSVGSKTNKHSQSDYGNSIYSVPNTHQPTTGRKQLQDQKGDPVIYTSLPFTNLHIIRPDINSRNRFSSQNRQIVEPESRINKPPPRRETSISSVISASGTRHHEINQRSGRITPERPGKVMMINREESDYNDHSQYLSQSVTGAIYGTRVSSDGDNSSKPPLKSLSTYSNDISEEEIKKVGSAVIKLGNGDGQKRNVAFQNVVHKICDVINVLLSTLPGNLFPFKFELLDDNVHFETKGLRSFEFYVCPQNLDESGFEVGFYEDDTMLADLIVEVERKDIEHFFVEDPVTRIKRLSPCKMMIVFAYVLETSLNEENISTTGFNKKCGFRLPHEAEIMFSVISERQVQFSLKFPEEVSPYEVTLVLALDIKVFPNSSNIKRSREWPTSPVKKIIEQEGVHLLAKLGDKNLHSWTVSTLKARRTLLRLTDSSGNKLRVLLAFQILRESELSRPRLLLPLHLATVLFWACMKFPLSSDWTDENIGLRFMDLLLALRRCLWRGECRDFFFSCLNLFEGKTPEILHSVACRLDNIIRTPLKYLRRRVTVSDGFGDG